MVLIETNLHVDGVRPFSQSPAMEATFRAIKARYGDLSPDGADHFQAMPSSDPPTVRASRIESGARQSLGPQYWGRLKCA